MVAFPVVVKYKRVFDINVFVREKCVDLKTKFWLACL
jgi:hypothetical protein